jgi:hypothetical protein
MYKVSKQHVIGGLKPRWPKTKVVKWLEWGAIPAIAGLWFPDWSGVYIHQLSNTVSFSYSWLTLPPLVMFIGALVLFKACSEGIKNMGWHYKGVLTGGFLAIAFAAASMGFHFLIGRNQSLFGAATVLSIILAAFFAAVFFWFTIAKVAEISAETRSRRTRNLVAVFAIFALFMGLVSVAGIYFNNTFFPFTFRLTIGFFTVCFGFCRYGVYCYKTQKSIGASFTTKPDEQFWI